MIILFSLLMLGSSAAMAQYSYVLPPPQALYAPCDTTSLLIIGDVMMHKKQLRLAKQSDGSWADWDYKNDKLAANRDYAADPRGFARKCLVNVASAGPFSSDRTIAQYAREIWNV